MSAIKENLERQRAEAKAARMRLTGTLVTLQERLKPGALIDEAVGELRMKASDLAQEGMEMVRTRPVAVVGFGVALAAYAFRGSLWSAIIAAFSKKPAARTDINEFEDKPPFQDFEGEAFASPRMENEL